MSDLISRAEIISTFTELGKTGRYGSMCEWVIEIVKQLSPAEPKRGRWEITNLGAAGIFDCCSECKRVVKHKAPFYDFCPHCGADMREVTT